MKEKRSWPNKSLHLTRGAGAPLTGELNRYPLFQIVIINL